MLDEKKKGEKAKKKLEATDYEALSALLDFHSDRATAHAGFLVACIFGLFTILSLIQGGVVIKFFYSIAYWLLVFGGLYELLNFRDFAGRAQRITHFIRDHKTLLINRLEEKPKQEPIKRPCMHAIYLKMMEYFYRTK